MLVFGGYWDRGLVISLDCLVFVVGCVEDLNLVKLLKFLKVEVIYWEELVFCGYKRNILDRKFFLKFFTFVRI